MLFLHAWEQLSDRNNGSHKLLRHFTVSRLLGEIQDRYSEWQALQRRGLAHMGEGDCVDETGDRFCSPPLNSFAAQAKQARHLQSASLVKAFTPAT